MNGCISRFSRAHLTMYDTQYVAMFVYDSMLYFFALNARVFYLWVCITQTHICLSAEFAVLINIWQVFRGLVYMICCKASNIQRNVRISIVVHASALCCSAREERKLQICSVQRDQRFATCGLTNMLWETNIAQVCSS